MSLSGSVDLGKRWRKGRECISRDRNRETRGGSSDVMVAVIMAELMEPLMGRWIRISAFGGKRRILRHEKAI